MMAALIPALAVLLPSVGRSAATRHISTPTSKFAVTSLLTLAALNPSTLGLTHKSDAPARFTRPQVIAGGAGIAGALAIVMSPLMAQARTGLVPSQINRSDCPVLSGC